MSTQKLRHVSTLPNYFVLMVAIAESSDTEMATMLNDYFYSVVTCEDSTSLPAVDPIGGPLISDSMKFTQRLFKAKL